MQKTMNKYGNIPIEYFKMLQGKSIFESQVKSKAAKEFYKKLFLVITNCMFVYPIGLIESVRCSNMDIGMAKQSKKILDFINYGSTASTIVSTLETFFYELLIEKINNNDIKNKDDIKEYLKHGNLKKKINFQNMKYVKKYYLDELKIDISKSTEFQTIQKDCFKHRHLFIHNFGRNDADNDKMEIITQLGIMADIDMLL